jgi:hypothetical protein
MAFINWTMSHQGVFGLNIVANDSRQVLHKQIDCIDAQIDMVGTHIFQVSSGNAHGIGLMRAGGSYNV